MKKRVLAWCLTLCMLIGLAPAAMADETGTPAAPAEITPDYSWYTAAASDATEYTITSVAQLAGFAKLTQGKVDGITDAATNFADKTVKLGADITFADNQYWYYNDGDTTNNIPVYDYRIGTFAGTFDGADTEGGEGATHTITGLKFYNADIAQNPYMYLFNVITADGCIKNITLDTVTADINGYDYFGFLAKTLNGTATNCHVKNATANVAVSNSNKAYLCQTAAMFGYVSSATITDCTVSNFKINAPSGTDTTDRVAALVGESTGTAEKPTTVTNCSVSDVTFILAYKTKKLGGFVGQTNNTTITDCTATNVNIYVGTYYQSIGGFVGSAADGSNYTGCTVHGFTFNSDCTNYAGDIGGFASTTSGTVNFGNCAVTGLNMSIDVPDSNSWGAGGFVGWQSGTITLNDCSVSGTITATGAGTNQPAGGLVGVANGSGLTINSSSASGLEISATSIAGGIVGKAANSNPVILGDTEAAGTISASGMAGGLVGYVPTGANITFDNCTPATNVTGSVTDPVANAQDGEFKVETDGEITFTKFVCFGTVNGIDTGYYSIQAAVDAGATTVTLLQNVSEDTADFALNGVSHMAENEEKKNFVLNLNGFAFDGTITVYHDIASFTANGTAGEGTKILLTAPLGEHNPFEGWCKGANNENDLAKHPTVDGNPDTAHWIAVPGNTYHTHFGNESYKHIDAADRHFDFGTMTVGGAVPAAQSITFSYIGTPVEGETLGITGFENNTYFDISIDSENSLKAVFAPKANLPIGEYNERIYIIMHDGSSHEIWVHLSVQAAPQPPVDYYPVGPTAYPVSVPAAANGTVVLSSGAMIPGGTVTVTATPDAGYKLGSLSVMDAAGNAVALTAVGGNVYRFTMPNSAVTVYAAFTKTAAATHPFTDVPAGQWYSAGVQYVYENGIMNGVNVEGTLFDLNDTTSRAMLMTMLARMSGVDTSVGATWDAVGMAWAKANGISDGTNGGAPITREQLVTMLYRYASSPAVNESALAALGRYSDYSALSNWAQYAMAWAVQNSIITNADGRMLPGGTASRAMVATILMRFCENIK